MSVDDKKTAYVTMSFPEIGFIVWLVFLIMKCANLNNPNYEWLTWFWVWFPLWIPWAIYLAISAIGLIIITLLSKRLE